MLLRNVITFWFFIGLSCIGERLFAQHVLSGRVTDAATKRGIALVHIIHSPSGKEFLSDPDGNFQIILPYASGSLLFKAYQFATINIEVTSASYIEVSMELNSYFEFADRTDLATKTVIQKVLKNRRYNNPAKEKNYAYDSYNKLVVTTSQIQQAKSEFKKLLDIFSIKLPFIFQDQHIFIMESVTKREFKNRDNQRETVRFTNTTGLKVPTGLSVTSSFQPLSIYEYYISIGPLQFISPLSGSNPFIRYVFRSVDTIQLEYDRLIVVKYNPVHFRQPETAKGLLYISERTGGIIYWNASPLEEQEDEFSIWQKSEIQSSGRWFPVYTQLMYVTYLGVSKIPIVVTNKTYNFNINLNLAYSRRDFNDLALIFDNEQHSNMDSIWRIYRKEPFTQKDQNTFTFYENIGNLKNLDNLLNFGQKLAQGLFKAGKVDIDLSRAITVNEVEGIRLGLGFRTNLDFSKKHEFGGFVGYGFGDNAWKYGAFVGRHWQDKVRSHMKLEYTKDLSEPGRVLFAFDKLQYSSEAFRRFRFPKFDVREAVQWQYNFHPLRNLQVRLLATNSINRNLYRYRFLPTGQEGRFDMLETGLALRYSPGERFAYFKGERFTLGTRYPEIWIQYSRGIKGFFGQYNYDKLDGKIQYTFRHFNFGTTGIQLIGGIVSRNTPYTNLFNAKGSFRDFSFIIHNSFETMQYNEFVSDRYFNIFFSHSFRKFQIKGLPYKPYFSIMHNIGWGSLAFPEHHENLEIKTMEKGYSESGGFLNDVFVLNFSGLKIGVGAGLFVRHGYYALPQAANNIVFKFATNLSF
jgi:hypothetical protein